MNKVNITIKQDDGTKRNIGYIKDDTYYKEVNEDRHLMKKMDAWGIDSKLFNKKLRDGGVDFIVYETPATLYITNPETVEEKGSYLHFKPYRPQIFLKREHWQKAPNN